MTTKEKTEIIKTLFPMITDIVSTQRVRRIVDKILFIPKIDSETGKRIYLYEKCLEIKRQQDNKPRTKLKSNIIDSVQRNRKKPIYGTVKKHVKFT